MTIKAYATKNKLSIFNVVKMIKSGALKSETVEENGKEVTYILAEPNSSTDTQDRADASNGESLEERVVQLEKDVSILKRELDALKMSMGIKG